MATYTGSDRTVNTADLDLSDIGPEPVRPRPLSPAERETWTPGPWTPEERERPTAPCPLYQPPADTDEAWFVGLQCGLERLAALPPEGYTDAERRAFLTGYEAGWADDTAEDWAEFSAWLDEIEEMHDSMRETYEDEMAERYARDMFAGHGAHGLD